tara:strand:- start:55 stop:705 length:651 start_codon:yes stop_codon:yes gene_type:complete
MYLPPKLEDVPFSSNFGGGAGITIVAWVYLDSMDEQTPIPSSRSVVKMGELDNSGTLSNLVELKIRCDASEFCTVVFISSTPHQEEILQVSAPNIIKKNEWAHIAAVYDAGEGETTPPPLNNQVVIYKNAAPVATRQTSGENFPKSVFRNTRTIGEDFEGKMRDVAGINNAMSQETIRKIMSQDVLMQFSTPAPPSPPSLESFYILVVGSPRLAYP